MKSGAKRPLPRITASPVVYLAGKISESRDWREPLIGMCGASFSWIDTTAIVEIPGAGGSPGFAYGGPFFGWVDSETPSLSQRIHDARMRRIERADFMLAHLNGFDAYAAIAEIGFASAIGVPVFLHFGKNIGGELGKFWFLRAEATATTCAPETSLSEALDSAILSWRHAAAVGRRA